MVAYIQYRVHPWQKFRIILIVIPFHPHFANQHQFQDQHNLAKELIEGRGGVNEIRRATDDLMSQALKLKEKI